MILRRNRAKHKLDLTDRLKNAAADARVKAFELKPGKEKDELLQKAREFESQVQMNAFLRTSRATLS